MDNFTPLKTKKKKKANRLLLAASILSVFVLVLVSSILVINNKVGQKPKATVNYCTDRPGSNTQCRDGVEWKHAWTGYNCPDCNVDAGCIEIPVVPDTNTGIACGGGGGCTNGGIPCGSITCNNGENAGSDTCYAGGSCESRATNWCASRGGVGSGNRHDITFTCDRCASDRRCQTPDIGVNPRYSNGAASGACAQVDNCNSAETDCTVVSLCAKSCSGTLPTPTPTTAPGQPSNTPVPTATSTPIPTSTPTPTPTTVPGQPTNTTAPTLTSTPTPTPTGTPGPTLTPVPVLCGTKGCDNATNPCRSGYNCVQANDGSNYCSSPDFIDACKANPSYNTCCIAPGAPTATPTEIILAKISASPTTVAKLLQTGVVKSFMYFIPAVIILLGLIL